MRRSLLPLAAALLLASPGVALAHKHIVAPGDPGSAQYQEDIPTASGSQPVTTLKPTSAPSAPTLPAAVVKKLSHDGAAGRATVSIAQQTAPPEPKRQTTAHALSYHAAATLSVLTSSLLGSGSGMGALLPIVLFLALGTVAVLALTRRRR
ncbi:MAG: hypothetical protein ABSC56_01650 [Solirubrobacteraceae bacterium]|jgi:hypothetical protein